MASVTKARYIFGLFLSTLLGASVARAAPRDNALDYVRETLQSHSIFALAFTGPKADQLFDDLSGNFTPKTESGITRIAGALLDCTKDDFCETRINDLQLIDRYDDPSGKLMTLTYETPFAEGSLRLKMNLAAIGSKRLRASFDIEAYRDDVFVKSYFVPPMVCDRNDIAPLTNQSCLFQSNGPDASTSPVSRTVTPSVYKKTENFLLSLQGSAAASMYHALQESRDKAIAESNPTAIQYEIDPISETEALTLPDTIACYRKLQGALDTREGFRCHLTYKPGHESPSQLLLEAFRLELTPYFFNAKLETMHIWKDDQPLYFGSCVRYKEAEADSPCVYEAARIHFFQYDLNLPPEGGAVAVGWGFANR